MNHQNTFDTHLLPDQEQLVMASESSERQFVLKMEVIWMFYLIQYRESTSNGVVIIHEAHRT